MDKTKELVPYYETFSYAAPVNFLFNALFAKGNAKRHSYLNRLLDYLALRESPSRLALHLRLNEAIRDQTNMWPNFDYGEGYFYQSFRKLGLRGLRSTEDRVEELGLKSRVAGKKVLEIGCNSGFLSLSLAERAASIEAFDLNPYLIGMAKICAEFLDVENVHFSATSFEKWNGPSDWDVILSFANHSTFDGNTQNTVEEYLERCHGLLKPGGLFLFESHHPSFETPEKVEAVLKVLSQHFRLESRQKTLRGSYFDRGRTFVIARK